MCLCVRTLLPLPCVCLFLKIIIIITIIIVNFIIPVDNYHKIFFLEKHNYRNDQKLYLYIIKKRK